MEPESSQPRSSLSEVETFTHSYSSFTSVIQKLQTAYRDLETRFQSLNIQLEKTNLRLQESLDSQEKIAEHLQSLLSNITSAVLAVDQNGIITYYNEAAQKIFSYPISEVIGKSYHAIFSERANLAFSAYQTLLTGSAAAYQEDAIVLSTGQMIPVGVATTLLRDRAGKIIGAMEVLQDLSVRKRLEKELVHSKTLSALGEMAATVAHEVRNPLGGIAGFAALLQRDLPANDPRRHSVEKIIEGVKHLERIVDSLLNYTREMKISPRRVDVVLLLKDFLFPIEQKIRQAQPNVHFKKHFPKQPFFVTVDPDYFCQAVSNLVHNSLYAVGEKGTITLSIGSEPARGESVSAGSAFSLEVQDDGAGMTEEVQSKLFTPFFTTREDGTGLGLSIVKKIIQAHGGAITVYSQLGQGTSFTIRIPLIGSPISGGECQ